MQSIRNCKCGGKAFLMGSDRRYWVECEECHNDTPQYFTDGWLAIEYWNKITRPELKPEVYYCDLTDYKEGEWYEGFYYTEVDFYKLALDKIDQLEYARWYQFNCEECYSIDIMLADRTAVNDYYAEIEGFIRLTWDEMHPERED